MRRIPLRASIELLPDVRDDAADSWSYAVVAQPIGAPDAMLAGHVRVAERGAGAEVLAVDINGLRIPDDLARKLLIAVFQGLWGRMDELDGDVAQYVTPDAAGYVTDRLYHADATRVMRALARHTAGISERDFEPMLWVSR